MPAINVDETGAQHNLVRKLWSILSEAQRRRVWNMLSDEETVCLVNSLPPPPEREIKTAIELAAALFNRRWGVRD